jgi:hypothetical protein
VIGGDLVAGREIHASSVQARGASTSLQILGDPRIVVGLRKVETTIEFCSKNTRRIIRTLGVDSVSQVKPLLRKMEPAARAGVMKLLKQLQTLTQAQDRRASWRTARKLCSPTLTSVWRARSRQMSKSE